jgi:hypothetical protein
MQSCPRWDTIPTSAWKDWGYWLLLTKIVGQDTRCSGRDSNQALPAYESTALPLHQSVWKKNSVKGKVTTTPWRRMRSGCIDKVHGFFLLRPLQLFYFPLWPIYLHSLVYTSGRGPPKMLSWQEIISNDHSSSVIKVRVYKPPMLPSQFRPVLL